MTLHRLQETSAQVTNVRATVCIVGAGVAGLIAATRIARRGVRVVVIESGDVPDDPALAALDDIDNPSPIYRGPMRARGLGGTSTKWAGKLIPLSESDGAPRPWIDLPGWPFPLRELDRYTTEIETLLGVDHASFEEDASDVLDETERLPRRDPDFTLRWPKRPARQNHDLAHVLRGSLESQPALEIWLGATATEFEVDATCGRLVSIQAVNHAGRTLEVRADEYLIAAGTLESTRLMLLLDRQANGAISRTTDALGSYFHDHLGLDVATLAPRDVALTNRMLADRWRLGADRHLHFELRPEVQAAHGIGSAYFDVGVEMPAHSALSQARLAVSATREKRPSSAARHGGAALADLPTLVQTVRWSLVDKQKYWPPYAHAQIKIWVEQLPRLDSRLTLSDQCDALGQPRLHVAFQRTDADERTFRTVVAKLEAFWSRHMTGVCALTWNPLLFAPDARLADAAVELYHPAGSTRAGRDPASSVVNPELRVHAIENLSIASASVFPASGSANPTFTIMQLAMRASDAILARIG